MRSLLLASLVLLGSAWSVSSASAQFGSSSFYPSHHQHSYGRGYYPQTVYVAPRPSCPSVYSYTPVYVPSYQPSYYNYYSTPRLYNYGGSGGSMYYNSPSSGFGIDLYYRR